VPELTIGCHLSVGRQPRSSIQESSRRGARCGQIFASSPGAWKPPRIKEEWSTELAAACGEFRFQPLVIHSIYLINLASTNESFVERSKHSLIETMNVGARFGAAAVVTHIGSHGGRGFELVAGQVIASLIDILEATPNEIDLVLENSAGAGRLLGSTLDELALLLSGTAWHSRLKVALDTAHLCGAGWDFTLAGEAERLDLEVQNTIGMERVALIHANDSKVAPGSRKDRHEAIGDGYIGKAGFLNLLAQPDLVRVPWILETPDLDTSLPSDRWMRSVQVLERLGVDAQVLEPAT
jgi:deoxyribonuclease-4